jgi:predicted helicase
VLDAVNWHSISKGNTDAWLYFYEDFLAVYDNALRKLTGSYYTPPEVVEPMIRLVDDVLRRHFRRSTGLASGDVTVADPAVGTGTFILGLLRRIAATVEADQGAGAVPQAVESAIDRLIAFEMQLGPFAVAQLRVYAELIELIGKPPRSAPRMFVTDTLGDPFAEVETLGSWYGKISESRRKANEIKRTEPITVVIGNPPYKERAKHGSRRLTGASAPMPNTSATSTSTSGGGPPGRSSTATRRTTPASYASSPSRVSSTAPVSSGCAITCGGRPT